MIDALLTPPLLTFMLVPVITPVEEIDAFIVPEVAKTALFAVISPAEVIDPALFIFIGP